MGERFFQQNKHLFNEQDDVFNRQKNKLNRMYPYKNAMPNTTDFSKVSANMLRGHLVTDDFSHILKSVNKSNPPQQQEKRYTFNDYYDNLNRRINGEVSEVSNKQPYFSNFGSQIISNNYQSSPDITHQKHQNNQIYQNNYANPPLNHIPAYKNNESYKKDHITFAAIPTDEDGPTYKSRRMKNKMHTQSSVISNGNPFYDNQKMELSVDQDYSKLWKSFAVNQGDINKKEIKNDLKQNIDEISEIISSSDLQKVDNFLRQLHDAKSYKDSFQHSQDVKQIASKIITEKRYEEFMHNNLSNTKRIVQFKKAIERRIAAVLNTNERKLRLQNLLNIKTK